MTTNTAVTAVTPLGQALRRLCATKLAVIAERRRARVATQDHLSHYNEAARFAADVYDATNADPHGDLSWRDEFELPY